MNLTLTTKQMKTLSKLFPEPQKINYRKFIQPMKQDFITKNGLTISNMIPNN